MPAVSATLMTTSFDTATFQPRQPLHGYCRRCGEKHMLFAGRATLFCAELMGRLISQAHLDFATSRPDAAHSTRPLFGQARGKMFGILEGIDDRGNQVVLRAFSGQYNGLWNIAGWVPPLFDEKTWQETQRSTEREIKRISAVIEHGAATEDDRLELGRKRKLLSQKLMARLHGLYRLQNFRGETATLSDLFIGSRGIPTGAGDCCAPKLLNYAAVHDIVPLGIAEFYWGRVNRSGNRVHGRFYPACTDKCLPLLGFLLCGLQEKRRRRIL